MKYRTKWMAILSVSFLPLAAYGLSRSIGRDIEFPKNYEPKKAESIRKVIRDERFKFVDGECQLLATRLGYAIEF